MRRIIKIINTIEEWTLVLILLGLAFLTCVQVFSRYCLNFSFTWFEEVARYLGVFVAFLGAALGVKYGSHFSMDLIYERVSNDRFRHALKCLVGILCGVIFIVVAYYGWMQTAKLHQFGAKTAVLQLPKYWAYLPVPFFSLVISWRFFALSSRCLKSFIRNEPFALSDSKQ